MPPGGTMGENRRDSPLRRGGAKELREHLEHVPPRTRGDFRGVAGNPHQVLIQQWLPPSSPPLERGGRSETCKDSRILSHLQGLGVCISKAFNNHMNATSL